MKKHVKIKDLQTDSNDQKMSREWGGEAGNLEEL